MNIAGDEGELSEEEVKEVAFEVHEILPSYQDNEKEITLSEVVEQLHSDVNKEAVKEALLFLESNPHVEVESHIHPKTDERRWFRA